MSLKSLFIITLSALLLIILTVVFVINLQTTQRFIENQLYSSSQDTVYSLGLSLATLDAKENPEDIELMVNAIFDSGYYEYIKYEDINSSIIYETSLPLLVKSVPSWFISLLPIHIHEASANVNTAWRLQGILKVKAHAGYAYYELYKSFKELVFTFTIISIIAFFVLILIINSLLYSLTRIRLQAKSINEHRFVIEKSSPFIKEFDLLIQTMNTMVHKVETIFKSEVQTFAEYQDLLYKDEETGLANKKFFMLKLKETLDDENRNVGYLAIICIDGLHKIKSEQGYDAYKKRLLHFIKNIPQELHKHHLLARISETEIAILFYTHDIKKIELQFNKLQDSLALTPKKIASKEKLLCYSIGVAPYFGDDKMSEAISRADYSLSRSKVNGCNILDVYEDKTHNAELITLGKESWKEMFDTIFSEKRIVLAMQSVICDTSPNIYHNEALIRIKTDTQELQTASYYLPMAHALQLIPKLDNEVITQVLQNIDTYTNPIAINISHDFILQSLYFLELRNNLSALRKSNPKSLHFESPENEVLLELDSYIEFSDMLHAHNQCFGIDRFSGLENIGYIEKVRPDYIKINVTFILEASKSNKAALHSLNILAQTMGISLIITAVQDKEQYDAVYSLGYRYFQGYFISDLII